MYQLRVHGLRSVALVGAACVFFAACAREPTAWPARPLKLDVAYAQGAGVDGLAHALAVRLGEALHTPVQVVEGRPGTPTMIAATFATPPASDEYSLLVASSDVLALGPVLDPRLAASLDPNVCPIALIAQTPHVLVTAARSRFGDLRDLADFARRHPGAVSYATLESGTAPYLIGELFAAHLDADLTHASYRSSASALRDVLGEHVSTMFATLQAAAPAIRAGQLRALAVSGAERADEFPDVPTFAELGLPELASTTWYGLFARCGLSRDVEDRLVAAAREAVLAPELDAALGAPAGAAPVVGESFAALMRDERARWSRMVALWRATADSAAR